MNTRQNTYPRSVCWWKEMSFVCPTSRPLLQNAQVSCRQPFISILHLRAVSKRMVHVRLRNLCDMLHTRNLRRSPVEQSLSSMLKLPRRAAGARAFAQWQSFDLPCDVSSATGRPTRSRSHVISPDPVRAPLTIAAPWASAAPAPTVRSARTSRRPEGTCADQPPRRRCGSRSAGAVRSSGRWSRAGRRIAPP
jgi:hypothetical protein